MSDDSISRNAAIDALVKQTHLTWEHLKTIYPMLNVLEELPSTERHEKWIPEFNGKFRGGSYWFHCSHCKRIVPDVRNGGWNYCPSCGAKMDGK